MKVSLRAVGEGFLGDQALGVVLVADRVAVLLDGLGQVAERIVGERLLGAVGVGDAEQVAGGIVAVLGRVAVGVGDRGQVAQRAVGHAARSGRAG